MLKNVAVACPYCGSSNVSGWYDEHLMRYIIRCDACGTHEEVMNIKFVEAFPEWFDVTDIQEKSTHD